MHTSPVLLPEKPEEEEGEKCVTSFPYGYSLASWPECGGILGMHEGETFLPAQDT